jgi:glycosyltransferase involved in cell wall biosynthesis
VSTELGAELGVSVVVATHGRERRLAALLRSLREQTLDPALFEVIVVDDGSPDGTAGLLRAEAADCPFELRPVIRGESGGPARARNQGWRLARAPLVAFTDDDCEADPSWLERFLEAAQAAPGAIVQGCTRPNPGELSAAGPFSVTRDVDGSGPRWFETCNIAYPRELLERLDGFDESFPEPLGEDTDLGWRALALGVTRAFSPEVLVYHAVEDLGPARHLRGALLGADGVLIFRRHAALRAEALSAGVIRNHAHLRLLIAAAGVLVGGRRRWWFGALLALPYLRLLLWRCRRSEASPAIAPYFVLYDLLTLYTTAKGDLRHRVLVI